MHASYAARGAARHVVTLHWQQLGICETFAQDGPTEEAGPADAHPHAHGLGAEGDLVAAAKAVHLTRLLDVERELVGRAVADGVADGRPLPRAPPPRPAARGLRPVVGGPHPRAGGSANVHRNRCRVAARCGSRGLGRPRQTASRGHSGAERRHERLQLGDHEFDARPVGVPEAAAVHADEEVEHLVPLDQQSGQDPAVRWLAFTSRAQPVHSVVEHPVALGSLVQTC
mmetsp:Transcript_30550/g.70882  ORF Transcript_30550/g.70882 Transcript_30550/m.70882 type:complete len:228 (+) Transcript_30550:166-849(+)